MTPNNRNIVGHYPLGMSELDLLLYDPNVYALWRTDGFDKEMFQSDDSGKYGVLSNNMIFSQATYYPQLAAVAQVHMNRRYGPNTWNQFNHTNAKPFGEAGYFGETTSNYNNENMFNATESAVERQMARTLYSQLMYGMPYPPQVLAKNREMMGRNGGESNLTGKTIPRTIGTVSPRSTATVAETTQLSTSGTGLSLPSSVSPTSSGTSTNTSTLQQIPTSVSPTSTTTTTTSVTPRTSTLVASGLPGTTILQPVTTTGSIPRPIGPGTSIVTTTPGGTTIVEPVPAGTTLAAVPMGGGAPMGGGGGALPEDAGARQAGEGEAGGAGGGGMEELQKTCKLNYMPVLFGGLILGGIGYFYAKNKKKDIKMPLIIMALAGAVLGYLYSKHQCKPNATLSKLGVKSKIVEDMKKIEAQKQAAAPKQEKKYCGCGA